MASAVNLHFMSYWDVLTKEDAQELLVGGHRLPDDMPGHAQEFETAWPWPRFLKTCGETYGRIKKTPSRHRNGGLRSGIFDRIIPRVAAYMDDMLAGRRTNPTPPFHP